MPSESARYEVAKLQRTMVSFWGVRPLVKCSCPGGWDSQCEEAPLDSVRAQQPSGLLTTREHAVMWSMAAVVQEQDREAVLLTQAELGGGNMLPQGYPGRPSWSAGLPMRGPSLFGEHAQVTLRAKPMTA